MQRHVAVCALALAACGRAAATSSVGGEPLPTVLSITGDAAYDGSSVSLVAARGETLGVRIAQPDPLPVRVELPGARSFVIDRIEVVRPSTALFGGSRGRGSYPDGLRAQANPAAREIYVEIVIPRDAAVGPITGAFVIGERRIPVSLSIAPVTLPAATPRVWAYVDPTELGAKGGSLDARERQCAREFADRGVMLSPDLPLAWWPARQASLAGVRDLPVVISADPARAGDEVRAWIAATRGTGHVPFAIPIDEPRTAKRRAEVVALARVVRAAGGGPTTFRFAVTDVPRAEYGDLVDLYIALDPAPRSGAWRYNGAPPYAGSMVLDADAPGPRTWGWIAWRDEVPRWYVWDALYWHDRHNRQGAPRPGPPLDLARDAVSFDDGEDHGNLDGVLALPAPEGCRPTLRLAALGRGQQDQQLLERAAACDASATSLLVRTMMPRGGAWTRDAATWETARRSLVAIASCR